MAKKKDSKTSPPQAPSSHNEKLKNQLLRESRLMENGFTIQNGLSDVLNDVMGMGFPYGARFSTQLSQVDTLFKNNRWYLISNLRQLLSQIYAEHGLIQTICNVPVDDAFRGGVSISSKQLSEEQVEELELSMDRDNDLNVLAQTCIWNRLFGGGGTIIITGQDASKPFDPEELKEGDEVEFKDADLWELFYSLQDVEGDQFDPRLQVHKLDHFDYYGRPVHKSRVMIQKGVQPPSFIRQRLRGWGLSVVEAFVRSVNQYLKANDLTFEVIDEFKLDIFKIKNLTNGLASSQAQAQVKRRLELLNRQKNYINSMVMDSEDDYVQKQLSFSGLAEVQAGFRMQIASDLRMPITKIFGTSVSSGMKTDQNDMENYNAMVESEIRQKVKHHVLKMLEIKCQVMFGMIPDDLKISFKPLRVLSADEEENVKTQQFTRLIQSMQAGLLTNFEFREACNRAELLPITLDTKEDTLNPADPEIVDVLEGKNMEDESGDEGEDKSKKDDKAKKKVNSIEYDKAAFEVDGGDQRIDAWKHRVYLHPVNVNRSLWERAKDASLKAYGREHWQFIVWWYESRGGKLH